MPWRYGAKAGVGSFVAEGQVGSQCDKRPHRMRRRDLGCRSWSRTCPRSSSCDKRGTVRTALHCCSESKLERLMVQSAELGGVAERNAHLLPVVPRLRKTAAMCRATTREAAEAGVSSSRESSAEGSAAAVVRLLALSAFPAAWPERGRLAEPGGWKRSACCGAENVERRAAPAASSSASCAAETFCRTRRRRPQKCLWCLWWL